MPRRSSKPLASPPPLQMEKKKLPPWIDALMWSTFFDRCGSHPQWYGSNRRCPARTGCNILCVDCRVAVCARCAREERHHRGHRAIQLRVYSYQNVVRVADIKPFLDVARVQTYFVNGFRVVCVNRRPKSAGRWPGVDTVSGTCCCKVCSRLLTDVCDFCSIECKVCDYTSSSTAAARRRSPEATNTVSKATVILSGARKRARKATPQRAHLGCTL